VRVLVVDDDEAVRSALTHALHRDGYEVSTAADGATALATLLRLRHDAVVLDVLMPEPGGLEVWPRDQGARRRHSDPDADRARPGF